ncbi:MAG: type III-B CRISPR module RAMP protein Cmr1 [Spirochaetales bacterium]
MEFNLNHYKNIVKKTYELEVVTPLFLGGADPTHAEIRPASLKGILRFWWRAIYGPQICEPYIKNGKYEKGLQELKKQEEAIFGSQDQKSKLHLTLYQNENIKPSSKRLNKGALYTVTSSKGKFYLGIIDYLAYGLNRYDRESKDIKYIRSYFSTETKITLGLKYPKDLEDSIITTLIAVVSFGGLGAKTRNGFGSLFNEELIISFDEICKKACNLDNTPLPYTSFSKKSKLFSFPARNSWIDALSDIGIAYKDARLSLEKKHVYEKRSLIGRPIVQAGNEKIKHQRHAKPFFLHVNKVGGKYQGQILYLPYKYTDLKQLEKYSATCEAMVQKIQEAVQKIK